MTHDRVFRISIMVVVLLLATNLAVSFARQDSAREEAKATGTVAYRLIPVSNSDTQTQTQALLTLEGNAGYRLVMLYPTLSGNYFVFSKP
jgi:hypothetical protein